MQCDVTDLQGNHCPEIPEHTVMFDGVETHLCKRCFANVVAGAYGRHLTPRAADLRQHCGHHAKYLFRLGNGKLICGYCGASR